MLYFRSFFLKGDNFFRKEFALKQKVEELLPLKVYPYTFKGSNYIFRPPFLMGVHIKEINTLFL